MSQLGFDVQDSASHKRSRSSGKKGKSALAVGLSLLVLFGILGGAVFALSKLNIGFGSSAEDFSGEGVNSVDVTVKSGQTLAQIGQSLKAAGVVASVDAWLAAAKANDQSSKIGPGIYSMRKQMSATSALALMLDPASKEGSQLLIREGLRSWEIYALVAKQLGIPAAKVAAAAKSPKLGLPAYAKGNAEGFLFPATYQVNPGASPETVLKAMVDRWKKTEKKLSFEASAAAMDRTPYELLNVASLIQAEGHPDDFAKVSRVIHNRLGPDTWGGSYGLLQLDATLNYAKKSSLINLSKEDLKTDGPYNTYTRPGLPPTPISSPGEAAMKAAMNPAVGDWLYYVTVNPDTGETKFTHDYSQFEKFRQELRRYQASKG